jgi:tetratricopeptide (TPR) repeat protein
MLRARLVPLACMLVVLTAGCRSKSASTERREIGTVDAGYLVTTSEGTTRESARYAQASAALARGDVKAARALYQEIARREPGAAEPHVGLGACAMAEDALATAQAEYMLALTKDPSSSSAHVGLGSVAYARADYRTSADEYERAVALSETNPDAHWGAATAYDQLGDHARASAHARRFLELAPGSRYASQARALAR